MTFFLAPLMTLLYNENNNERVVIMFELVKVSSDDIRSIELLIEYRGENFRNKYHYKCARAHYNDSKSDYLDKLSDIEAMIYIVNKEHSWEYTPIEYLLLHDDVPVTSCKIRFVNPLTGDIELETLEGERHKGYALECLKRVEEELFKNTDLVFTTIKDLTTTGASTKMAISLGYKLTNTGYYVKMNPYISLEEAKERARSSRKAM